MSTSNGDGNEWIVKLIEREHFIFEGSYFIRYDKFMSYEIEVWADEYCKKMFSDDS